LPEGGEAIAKHKNGRYYHVKITDVVRRKQYIVDFDDGSVSDDLLPGDIVVSGDFFCVWLCVTSLTVIESMLIFTIFPLKIVV
jgi:hypothetical protein